MGLGVGSASLAAQLAEKGVIEDVVGLCYGSFGPDIGAAGEQSKNGAIIFGRIPEEGQLGLQWAPLVRSRAGAGKEESGRGRSAAHLCISVLCFFPVERGLRFPFSFSDSLRGESRARYPVAAQHALEAASSPRTKPPVSPVSPTTTRACASNHRSIPPLTRPTTSWK